MEVKNKFLLTLVGKLEKRMKNTVDHTHTTPTPTPVEKGAKRPSGVFFCATATLWGKWILKIRQTRVAVSQASWKSAGLWSTACWFFLGETHVGTECGGREEGRLQEKTVSNMQVVSRLGSPPPPLSLLGSSSWRKKMAMQTWLSSSLFSPLL